MNHIEPDCEKFIHESKQLEKAYAEACEWISSFGIPYQKTRFGEYEKDVSKFINNRDSSDARKSIHIFLNAHKEANELVRLMNVYRSFDPNTIIVPIKRVMSGQRFRDASNGDQSRDFAFELGVASRFIIAGYPVELRSISDLVVDINGTTLYVECKRLKSLKQLTKRTREANEQIKRRVTVDKSSKSRGMIALEVTDIVMDIGSPLVFPSIETHQEVSRESLKAFVLHNKEMFVSKKVKKCLGVFTEFVTQGIVIPIKKDEELAFSYIREANILNYPMSTSEQTFMNSFWRNLGNQNIL